MQTTFRAAIEHAIIRAISKALCRKSRQKPTLPALIDACEMPPCAGRYPAGPPILRLDAVIAMREVKATLDEFKLSERGFKAVVWPQIARRVTDRLVQRRRLNDVEFTLAWMKATDSEWITAAQNPEFWYWAHGSERRSLVAV